MATNDDTTLLEQHVPTHGILVLHGAGMPEDQKTKVGDTLATIANGLIDFVSGNPLLSKHYQIATKARLKPTTAPSDLPELDELELTLWRKDENEKRTAPAYRLRMREVLWKPIEPARSPLEYLPFLWLCAFTLRSHSQRLKDWEEWDKKPDYDGARLNKDKWDEQSGLPTIETAAKYKRLRREKDFRGRIILAILGLLATLLLGYIAGALIDWLFAAWASANQSSLQLITTGVALASWLAAALLFLLAVEEARDRKNSRPHGAVHLVALAATTTWLALFLAPFLLLLYFGRRILKLALILALTLGPIVAGVTVQRGGFPPIENWLFSIAFILVVAVIIWWVSWYVTTMMSHTMSQLRDSGLFHRLTNGLMERLIPWLVSLGVVIGAPVFIVFISALQVLSVIPIGGGTLKTLAQNLSDAFNWDLIKDIHMFVTDSGRSAAVRRRVEEAIQALDNTDSIHILAHSLGTVVAYDTLAHLGRGDGACIRKNDDVYKKITTLVTYGGPLNKIRMLADKVRLDPDVMAGFGDLGFDYPRFSGYVQDTHAANGEWLEALAKLPDDLADFRWLNFFALQDWVSDVYTLYYHKKTNDNKEIGPHQFTAWTANDIITAHGAYWTDPGFWNTTLQAMGIIYSKGKLLRIENLRDSKTVGNRFMDLREEGILTQEQLLAKVSDFGICTLEQLSTKLNGLEATFLAKIADEMHLTTEKLWENLGVSDGSTPLSQHPGESLTVDGLTFLVEQCQLPARASA